MEFRSSHIPPLLRKVLDGNASVPEINLLVRYAHHFALIRLKQLLSSGRLHLQSFPITLESIAIDCIAELFERDSDGVFIELEHFFCAEQELNLLTDDDIIAYFRSLVFTKLYDSIFALYRENDPVLSKILRNVKSVLQQSTTFVIEQYLGLSTLVYASNDDRKHLPEIPLETVECYFIKNVRGVKRTTEYLEAFEQLIRESSEFRNSFPFINLCVCIKRHIMQQHISLNSSLSTDDFLFENDASSLVDNALLEIRKNLYERYVTKNKLGQAQFTAYMNAIDQMVQDAFLRNDGNEKNYGEYLQQHLPNISYEEYREHHRKQFEYMTKLAKKAVRERLKELL